MTKPKHALSIMTKYLGPTNFRGGRVKAVFGNGKSLTVSWDHTVGVYENHAMAAAALAEKLELGSVDVGSELPEASKFAYVFLCGVTIIMRKPTNALALGKTLRIYNSTNHIITDYALTGFSNIDVINVALFINAYLAIDPHPNLYCLADKPELHEWAIEFVDSRGLRLF